MTVVAGEADFVNRLIYSNGGDGTERPDARSAIYRLPSAAGALRDALGLDLCGVNIQMRRPELLRGGESTKALPKEQPASLAQSRL